MCAMREIDDVEEPKDQRQAKDQHCIQAPLIRPTRSQANVAGAGGIETAAAAGSPRTVNKIMRFFLLTPRREGVISSSVAQLSMPCGCRQRVRADRHRICHLHHASGSRKWCCKMEYGPTNSIGCGTRQSAGTPPTPSNQADCRSCRKGRRKRLGDTNRYIRTLVGRAAPWPRQSRSASA